MCARIFVERQSAEMKGQGFLWKSFPGSHFYAFPPCLVQKRFAYFGLLFLSPTLVYRFIIARSCELNEVESKDIHS